MPGPIGQLSELLIYATAADLPDDGQQEVGNVAVAVSPLGLYVWGGTAWGLVGGGVADDRVTRIEERLSCLAHCLSEP